jgi:hypothetical protein
VRLAPIAVASTRTLLLVNLAEIRGLILNLNIMFEIATQYQIHLYFNVMLDDLVLFITASILVMDKTMHVIGYRYK